MLAIGLRSSCAVSDTRSRWRCCASASRESMSFSVTASERTSSRAGGTGRWRGIPVWVTSAAPRRSPAMGRSVYPVTSQMARATRPNSSGVPMNTALATVAMLSLAWAKETAATTTWPSFAPTATTRSGDGMPSGGPDSMRALAGPGRGPGLRRRQQRHQPVRALRHVGDPALGVEHLDGDRAGPHRHRVGQPVLVDQRRHLRRALPGRVVQPADQGQPQRVDQQQRGGGQGQGQPGRGDQGQPGPQAAPPPPASG